MWVRNTYQLVCCFTMGCEGDYSGMHIIYLLSRRIWILGFKFLLVWSTVGLGSLQWFVCFLAFFVDYYGVCILCVLIGSNVLLICLMRSFSLVSKVFIDGICELALAHMAKTMVVSTFHVLIAILFMRSWYFEVFLSKVSLANALLQYLTSI